MTDPYKDNASARAIINGQLARSMKPLNKFNFPMHHNTEVMTGEVSDRQPSDIGMEQELINNNN